MGFNPKLFAAAFMTSQAKSINQRLKDAADYKEEQEELARNNIGLYKTRKMQPQQRLRLAQTLRDMGASKETIFAYANSGAGALTEAVRTLQGAKQTAGLSGNEQLPAATINLMLDSGDEFRDIAAEPDMSIEKFLKKTSGLYQDLMANESEEGKKDPTVHEGNWLRAAFGFDAKARAKQALREKYVFEDMTVQELNDIARTEDLQQVVPNVFASIKAVPQAVSTTERISILKNFSDYVDDQVDAYIADLQKSETRGTIDIMDLQTRLKTSGSDLRKDFEREQLPRYLDGIGSPLTESLVLSARYGLDPEVKQEIEKEKEVEQIVDESKALESTELKTQLDALDQQSLALNYPEAPRYDYEGPTGGIEEAEAFYNFVLQNDLEKEVKDGQSVVIVDEGKYQVLTEDKINNVKKEIEDYNTELGDITPLAKTLKDVGTFIKNLGSDEMGVGRTINDVITNQTKKLSLVAGAFVTINERKAAQALLDDLTNNLDTIGDYLNNNPDKLSEFRKDPSAFLKKYNLVKEE